VKTNGRGSGATKKGTRKKKATRNGKSLKVSPGTRESGMGGRADAEDGGYTILKKLKNFGAFRSV